MTDFTPEELKLIRSRMESIVINDGDGVEVAAEIIAKIAEEQS